MLYPTTYGIDARHPQARDFAVVRKNRASGQGVISRRAFKLNDVLAVITGETVLEIRQHTLQISNGLHLYDPYFSGYLLHSCSPNVSVNMQTMTVTALRDIPANSFLYMDYAETEDVLFKQFPCSCEAQECRGWITGRRERPLLAKFGTPPTRRRPS